MGLLTENNNPSVSSFFYTPASLINSDNKGDYHEAFNLGLDPSLGYAVEESGGEGELEHGDNLWPDKEVWSGAERFVSWYRCLCIDHADMIEEYMSRLLVSLLSVWELMIVRPYYA
jgi:hypothetical protein